MIPPLETSDLARRLLDYETATGPASALAESAVFRVYEKLRRSICALAGVAGFRSLASRALTLARREAPNLSSVQVTADGYLQGLVGFDSQDDHQAGGGVILIAQLLGLLFTFIGEALTLRLMQDAWPDAVLEIANPGTGGKHGPTK
jgi:hypothetical protein